MTRLAITELGDGRVLAMPVRTSQSALGASKPKSLSKPRAKPSPKTTAVKADKPEHAIKGMTAIQLSNATPPYIRSHAKSVIIKALKPTSTKGGLFAVRAVAVDIKHDRPRPHKCHVIGLDRSIQKLFDRRQTVQVSCECEFFTFTCEYALWKNNAAKIIHSNGEPAMTTNPGNRPLLCKHLFALMGELKKHGY